MAHFKFAVAGQYLDLLTPTKGISDDLNANSCEFEFRTPEWENCEKWAHFSNPDFNDGKSYDFILVGDEITADRGLNLPVGIWEVYLHGNLTQGSEVIRRYITETALIQIVQSNVVDNSPLGDVAPSVAEQLSATVQDVYKDRITSATVTVDNQIGTPYAVVDISGEEGAKVLNFEFHNVKGNGIEELEFRDDGTLYIDTSGDDPVEYTGIRDAMAQEAIRVSAERERVSSESLRAQNERNRESAEDDREAAENLRATAEGLRAVAERDRIASENARIASETVRSRGEAERSSAERTRITNETARTEAESGRLLAETQRATAETGRLSAEENRVTAEQGRVTAETARVTAEQGRVTAEGERSAEFSQWRDEFETRSLAAEGHALGTQNGVAVGSDSPYYQNNAKYYAEEAGMARQTSSENATRAETAETNAAASAQRASASEGNAASSELTAVASANSALTSENKARTSDLKAEGYSVGTQDGTDVTSSSPYYHNSAKYYCDLARASIGESFVITDPNGDGNIIISQI